MANADYNPDNMVVFVEEMRENFRIVMAAVDAMQQHVQALPEIQQNTRLLTDDTQALKVAIAALANEVGGLSDQVEHHEHRINGLEAA